ncbi:hypothetical protein phi9184_ORF039 [Enterococcus phage 9184]|uniref:Uncharacterized protein n=1 Tax=Enterococcus phage 9184 TaxID=2763103 RepID=A0A7L8ZII2_9CAUD|nr:hypothetical protein phi9184_ORF039 [Enterococcus phage 9184]
MMKLFIKTLFTLLYTLLIGATIVYASNTGFLTITGNILVSILFGSSIKIMVDWAIKEEE